MKYSWLIVNDELGGMLQRAFVVCFKVLSKYLPERIMETIVKSQDSLSIAEM
jgi:hypothetical protein